MDKWEKKMSSREFKKLNRLLYRLPEILPKREIDKYQNIWVDVYNYEIPTRVLAKSKLKWT